MQAHGGAVAFDNRQYPLTSSGETRTRTAERRKHGLSTGNVALYNEQITKYVQSSTELASPLPGTNGVPFPV